MSTVHNKRKEGENMLIARLIVLYLVTPLSLDELCKFLLVFLDDSNVLTIHYIPGVAVDIYCAVKLAVILVT